MTPLFYHHKTTKINTIILKIIPDVAYGSLKWFIRSSEIALEGLIPHPQDARYPPKDPPGSLGGPYGSTPETLCELLGESQRPRGTSGNPPEALEGRRRHPQDARYPTKDPPGGLGAPYGSTPEILCELLWESQRPRGTSGDPKEALRRYLESLWGGRGDPQQKRPP